MRKGMILCFLVFFVLRIVNDLHAEVISKDFCFELPEATHEELEKLVSLYPSAEGKIVKILSLDAALIMIQNAAESKVGIVEFLSEDAWRDDCIVYISQEILKAIDDIYHLNLLIPLFGIDADGNQFYAKAFFSGEGRHVVLYVNEDGQRINFLKYKHVEYKVMVKTKLPVVMEVSEVDVMTFSDLIVRKWWKNLILLEIGIMGEDAYLIVDLGVIRWRLEKAIVPIHIRGTLEHDRRFKKRKVN